MKLLYIVDREFGSYSRVNILVNGMRKKGTEVDVFSFKKTGIGKVSETVKLISKVRTGGYDFLVVCDKLSAVPLRLLTGTPVVLDAFISVYEALVLDQKLVKKNSFRALGLWMTDFLSCKFSHWIFLDTRENADYFRKSFYAPGKKFSVVPIGADENVFKFRRKKPDKKFIVSFHGNFFSLHGIEYIIEAARMLRKEKIEFRLYGKGNVFGKAKKMIEAHSLDNVKLYPDIYIRNGLVEHLSRADVCLGIFGPNIRGKRAVPTKVFECLALKKPVITGDNSTMRSAFTSGKNCLLVEHTNAEQLAEAVMKLKKSKKLRERIAENGYRLFKKRFSIEKVAGVLLENLNRLDGG